MKKPTKEGIEETALAVHNSTQPTSREGIAMSLTTPNTIRTLQRKLQAKQEPVALGAYLGVKNKGMLVGTGIIEKQVAPGDEGVPTEICGFIAM